jgi:hypothetical protein
VSHITSLKASLCAEEVRLRSACERAQVAAAGSSAALQKVQHSSAALWSEVVRRKIGGPDAAAVNALRERVAGGPEEALKKLAADLKHQATVEGELAQHTAAAATLHQSVAARNQALERAERRQALRWQNQEQEELADVAVVSSTAHGPSHLVSVCIEPASTALIEGTQNVAVVSAAVDTSALRRPSGATDEGVGVLASNKGEVNEQATSSVNLTITDPVSKVATARVHVTAEAGGALVAEVTIPAPALCERVLDHRSQIVRKLTELNLPLTALTISHGDGSLDNRSSRRQLKVKRKQEESEDEVCVV